VRAAPAATMLVPVDVFALRRRRERLAASFASPALLAAGLPRARNYPANPYPFRAESHYLYFAGTSIPGAALLIDGPRSVLFAPAPAEDDALWHGEAPTFADYKDSSGVDDVLPLEAAEEVLRARDAATLPPNDDATAAWLSRVLGRPVRARAGASVEGADAALADAVIALRLRHDEAAVAELRAAVAITVRAHHAGARRVRPGARESEVRAAIEAEMIAAEGAPAYRSIVTTRGEVLHKEASPHVLGPSDLLLVDAGSESPSGWASDVTRVYPAAGAFSPTQRALYDVVLAANRAAIALVRPGVRYRDVHLRAARTIVEGLLHLRILRGDPDTLVERGAHALFFPHGVGHLLGLDVHDMEDLGDRAGYAPGRTRAERFGDRYLRLDRDLQPGMAVTIEPGFYQVPAILGGPLAETLHDALDRDVLARYADVRGIRLEDDVLVGEGAPEVLTHAIPIDPDEVARWMKE
jgi:Xaa-Pro aminopeptidase